jgi:trimeric autotransporter adhesin
MTTISNTYINALLSDAAYVLSLENKDLATYDKLTTRMTATQAAYIGANFTVLNQIETDDLWESGFDATVWKQASDGKLFVSMRGTDFNVADLSTDIKDVALDGNARAQLIDMVNWWFKQTAPAGAATARQITWGAIWDNSNPNAPYIKGYGYIEAASVAGTGTITAADLAAGVEVNGHSLGGYLATAFTRLFGTQANVSHTSTFNSAGFAPGSESTFAALNTLIGPSLGRSAFPSTSDSSQDNYFAANGINFTTNTAWFSQAGVRKQLEQENSTAQVPNHYMYKMTDLLALGAALEKLDPNLTFDKLNSLIKAGSNDMKASYEGVLDALRKALLGTSYLGNTLIGDVNDNAVSRQDFHQNLKALQDSQIYKDWIATTTVISGGQPQLQAKLTIRPAAGDTALVNKAISQFSDFIALYTLSPLILEGANPAQQTALDTALGANNTDLYQNWQLDAALRAQGKAPETFTDAYLNDRQAMLQRLQIANINDAATRGDGAILLDSGNTNNTSYEDIASNIKLGYLIDNAQTKRIVFGSNSLIFGDDTLTGATQADRLYGGGGNDRLDGLGGNDYLEGNAGDDTLIGGAGNDTLMGGTGLDRYEFSTLTGAYGKDTLIDADGLGSIIINGLTLSTTQAAGAANRWSAKLDANNFVGLELSKDARSSTSNPAANSANHPRYQLAA